MQQGDTDGAETLLRQLAEETPDEPGPWLTLVQFLQQTRAPMPRRRSSTA